MIAITNPYDLEFRTTCGGQLIIYAGRSIAKVTTDGTLMTHATEAARVGNVLDTLGLSKAMFLVETEEQLIGVLDWPSLRLFTRLTLNLYFLPSHEWIVERLHDAAQDMQHLEYLEITGAVPLPILMGDRLLDVFRNIPVVKILGHSHP